MYNKINYKYNYNYSGDSFLKGKVGGFSREHQKDWPRVCFPHWRRRMKSTTGGLCNGSVGGIE